MPMRREELIGRKGKAPDGQAKTRMAALGCIFTQSQLDDKGHPLRDHASTTYLAGFESPSDFGIGLRREALRRRLRAMERDGQIMLNRRGATFETSPISAASRSVGQALAISWPLAVQAIEPP